VTIQLPVFITASQQKLSASNCRPNNCNQLDLYTCACDCNSSKITIITM